MSADGNDTSPRWVKLLSSAPLTVAWLVVLLATTRIQRTAPPDRRRRKLRRESTNLLHLRRDPVRVLFTSLLWLDGFSIWVYVPLHLLFLAPAERRLGSARWLATGLAAHIAATYVGQGYLQLNIRRANAPVRLINARDVGVSYFLLGIAGRLTGLLKGPWRTRSQTAGTVILATNVVFTPTFTEVGHLSAFLVGVAAERFGAALTTDER